MFKVLTLSIALVACVLGFWFPRAAWLTLALPSLFFAGQLLTVRRQYKLEPISSLSSGANELLVKYGHYFSMPSASREFSAASAVLQFAGIALAVITWFSEFRLGVLFAVVNWFVMNYVACSFSPAALLAKSPDARHAHDEVAEFIQSTHNLKK